MEYWVTNRKKLRKAVQHVKKKLANQILVNFHLHFLAFSSQNVNAIKLGTTNVFIPMTEIKFLG